MSAEPRQGSGLNARNAAVLKRILQRVEQIVITHDVAQPGCLEVTMIDDDAT